MTTTTSGHHPVGCARELRFGLLVQTGSTDPPPALLHRLAVQIHRCCGHHLLKAHRLAWGLTVRDAVAAVNASYRDHPRGLDERTWRRWEHGGRQDADYQDALCAFFQTGPVQLGLATDYTDRTVTIDHTVTTEITATATPTWPPAPATGSSLPTRTARMSPDPAHKAPAPAGGPHAAHHADRPTIERLISMAAHESADFHDRLSAGGPASLELLRIEATRLARSFANAPRLTVFTAARRLRDQAFGLLTDGGHLADSRDLYFITGAACGMLAEITENFGFRAEAMAHARTGWLCAQRAGHNGLSAWILGEQSLIAYWDGRPAHAVEYARRGQPYATSGSVSVWLPALEARAAGKLGNTDTVRDALTRAGQAREQASPGDLDEFGGIMAFHVGRQYLHGAQANLGLADGPAVIEAAEACVTAYRNGPTEERALDNEVSAQVTLASAQVLVGDLDAARAATQPAFALRPELRTSSIDTELRDLHRRLAAPTVADASVAVDLRDQIEDFLATPASALPST